jgi:DNA-binding transcriptional LysR family regulator
MPEADLNLLIALDALLAEGSVAGAAQRLGLSASAMSRALARLRAATGDPLLVRAGRGRRPRLQAVRRRRRVRRASAGSAVDLMEASCFRSRRAVKGRSPPAAAREERALDSPSASEVLASMRSTAPRVGGRGRRNGAGRRSGSSAFSKVAP